MSQLDMFSHGSPQITISGKYPNLQHALHDVQKAHNDTDNLVKRLNELTVFEVDAQAGGGKIIVIPELEFGRTYHIKIEITETFTGRESKFVVAGPMIFGDEYIKPVKGEEGKTGAVVIQGTEHEGSAVYITWRNTPVPRSGKFKVTVKAVG